MEFTIEKGLMGKPRKLSIKWLDEEYLTAGKWKCSNSPTGAHYWIRGLDKIWRCKHCEEIQELKESP